MDNNNPPSIRQQAEDLLFRHKPVSVMHNGDMTVGRLDGVAQHGVWIQPIGLVYIPYSDIESIRVADPEEV